MKTIIIALAALGAVSTAAFAEPRDERYSLIDKWEMGYNDTTDSMNVQGFAAQTQGFAVDDNLDGLTSFEKAKREAMKRFGPGGSSSSDN